MRNCCFRDIPPLRPMQRPHTSFRGSGATSGQGLNLHKKRQAQSTTNIGLLVSTNIGLLGPCPLVTLEACSDSKRSSNPVFVVDCADLTMSSCGVFLNSESLRPLRPPPSRRIAHSRHFTPVYAVLRQLRFAAAFLMHAVIMRTSSPFDS